MEQLAKALIVVVFAAVFVVVFVGLDAVGRGALAGVAVGFAAALIPLGLNRAADREEARRGAWQRAGQGDDVGEWED